MVSVVRARPPIHSVPGPECDVRLGVMVVLGKRILPGTHWLRSEPALKRAPRVAEDTDGGKSLGRVRCVKQFRATCRRRRHVARICRNSRPLATYALLPRALTCRPIGGSRLMTGLDSSLPSFRVQHPGRAAPDRHVTSLKRPIAGLLVAYVVRRHRGEVVQVQARRLRGHEKCLRGAE